MARVYDLAMTHKLDADDFFIHRVQQHCAQRSLNFFLVEPLWVESFTKKLSAGEIEVRVLLNMHSEHHQPDEPFHRLIRLADQRKTRVIDPPDIALAAFDKALLHPRIISAGLNAPYTVIVPESEIASRRLTDEERARLGSPFVIKPNLGYGRKGVILDATSEADLARSHAQWPGGSFLLQHRIAAKTINGLPAYFRVYFVFGSVWLAWWNFFNDQYRAVSPEEVELHGLKPLREIVERVAQLSQMNFFSSEIALTEAGEFVLIDYVNDQCHLLTQSANPQIGVPDEIVAAIAHRLVEAAHHLIRS